MTIEEARWILGPDYEKLSDEQIEALIDLIEALCTYVIANKDTI